LKALKVFSKVPGTVFYCQRLYCKYNICVDAMIRTLSMYRSNIYTVRTPIFIVQEVASCEVYFIIRSARWKLYVCCVAIGNPELHVRKALHRGSKQQ